MEACMYCEVYTEMLYNDEPMCIDCFCEEIYTDDQDRDWENEGNY